MIVKKVTVTETTDPLALPPFLKRTPDNKLVDPTPWGEIKPLKASKAPRKENPQHWSDARLHEALSADMTVAERQPVYRELALREKKAKAARRIAELKARFVREEPERDYGPRTDAPEDYERQWI